MKYLSFLAMISLLAAGVFLLMPTVTSQAAPDQPDLVINEVYITDVRDGSFVVSWTTDAASDGHVDWGLTTALGNTTSDPIASTTTHYVTINGLTSNTPFFLQVRSGGVTDNNGGSYYTVTTGPTLELPGPGKTIWGYMKQSDGSTLVQNGIVYIQLQNADASGSPGSAQWVSARTLSSSSWSWSFDLVNVRTADALTYFTFTDGADQMRMIWQGGSYGAEGDTPDDIEIYTIPATFPSQIDKTLAGAPTAVSLVDYTASPLRSKVKPTLALSALLGIVGISLFVVSSHYLRKAKRGER